MRRNIIRQQKLRLASTFGRSGETMCKALVHAVMRLVHKHKHILAYMLGRHLKLTAHVFFHKPFKETAVFVCHDVIIPQSGADKHAFHARHVLDGLEHLGNALVADLKVRADFGRQARTRAAFRVLRGANGVIKVCRGPAHIRNVALKFAHLCDASCFLHDRFLGAFLDALALMGGDGTKRTHAGTTAQRSDAELHLSERGDRLYI